MYSRSFKPQLEDIKSSYMLLNKQNQDQNNKGNMDKGNFYFLTKCVFTNIILCLLCLYFKVELIFNTVFFSH